ncbi:unnamed protein product, partial [Choristocarpus tenellus]
MYFVSAIPPDLSINLVTCQKVLYCGNRAYLFYQENYASKVSRGVIQVHCEDPRHGNKETRVVLMTCKEQLTLFPGDLSLHSYTLSLYGCLVPIEVCLTICSSICLCEIWFTPYQTLSLLCHSTVRNYLGRN